MKDLPNPKRDGLRTISTDPSENLTKRLSDDGFQDKWVAEKLGITPQHYSKLKHGKLPINPVLYMKLQELVYGSSITVTDGRING